jgi:hypothetical protein
VLELLEQGYPNAAISSRLGCAHQRVSGRLRALRAMTGVSTEELPTMFLWDEDIPWMLHGPFGESPMPPQEADA